MEPRTRTVAYIRVSTDRQAEHGISLDAQRAKVHRLRGELYDLDLVDVIVDAGVSAKTLERPGLIRALAMLEHGHADALAVVKLDRLTRSVRDLAHLVDRYFAKGWALMSVSENVDTRSAAGRLVLNVIASVAQWEREAVGERTKAALALKKQRGEYTGGRPLLSATAWSTGARWSPIHPSNASSQTPTMHASRACPSAKSPCTSTASAIAREMGAASACPRSIVWSTA